VLILLKRSIVAWVLSQIHGASSEPASPLGNTDNDIPFDNRLEFRVVRQGFEYKLTRSLSITSRTDEDGSSASPSQTTRSSSRADTRSQRCIAYEWYVIQGRMHVRWKCMYGKDAVQTQASETASMTA
jgi:hypothetical protein